MFPHGRLERTTRDWGQAWSPQEQPKRRGLADLKSQSSDCTTHPGTLPTKRQRETGAASQCRHRGPGRSGSGFLGLKGLSGLLSHATKHPDSVSTGEDPSFQDKMLPSSYLPTSRMTLLGFRIKSGCLPIRGPWLRAGLRDRQGTGEAGSRAPEPSTGAP